MNFLAILVAAFVPLITGFIWYNQKTFSNAWIKAAGLTGMERPNGSKMALQFGLTFVFSFMLSRAVSSLVIHQNHIFSILINELKDPNSVGSADFKAFMEKYGHNFRTFKHGVLHGVLGALFIGLPIMGVNALFERKSARYVVINIGYWAVTMGIMGGILSAWE